MSDQSPPPKPKPGSLRDRIAAFENKPAAAPGPPAPRPKPAGGLSWKPRAQSPPPSQSANLGSAENASTPEKKVGGMNASDAKESIGLGGSLKERMAALQGRGAFGGLDSGASLPPKPATQKPKWKPPPVVSPPVDDKDDETPDSDTREPANPPPQAVRRSTEDDAAKADDGTPAGTEGAEEEQLDPEEEERQRRAAIAARMARLGGARVGMPPPIFGKKPSTKKTDPPKDDENLSLDNKPAQSPGDPSLQSPPIVGTPEVTTSDKPTGEASSDYFAGAAPRRSSTSSSLLSVDSASQVSKSPSSMPVPSVPRRAAPPRKKPPKSPSPAPVAKTLDQPLKDSPEMSTNINSDAVVESYHELQSADGQQLGEVNKEVEIMPEDRSAPTKPAPMLSEGRTVVEAPAQAGESENGAEEESRGDGGTHEPEMDIGEPIETPERPSSPPALADNEMASVKTAVISSPVQTGEVEEDVTEMPAEDEDEEAARRKRVAEKLETMGGINPLAPPPFVAPADDIIEGEGNDNTGSEAVEHLVSPTSANFASETSRQEDSEDIAAAPLASMSIQSTSSTSPSEPEMLAGEDSTKSVESGNQPEPVSRQDHEDDLSQHHKEFQGGAGLEDETRGKPEEERSPENASEDEEADEEIEQVHDAYEDQEETMMPERTTHSMSPPPIPNMSARPVDLHDERGSEGSTRRSLPLPPHTLPLARESEARPKTTESVTSPGPFTSSIPPPPPALVDEIAVEMPQQAQETEEPLDRGAPPPAPSRSKRPVPRQSTVLNPTRVYSPAGPRSPHVKTNSASSGTTSSPVSPTSAEQRSSSDASAPSTLPVSPAVAANDRHQPETFDDEEGDPIDPVFHNLSPTKTLSSSEDRILPPSAPQGALVPPTPAAEPETENDPEQAHRTIAERMAKLGGIRFGAPLPIGRAPPSTVRVETVSVEQPVGTPPEGQLEEAPLTEDEEERARKQRIASKLAGMGGIGMFGAPQRVAPQPRTRRQESGETDAVVASQRAIPPSRPPPPPQQPDTDFEPESHNTSEDGVKVELEDSEPEEVHHEDVAEAEVPPPIPSRAARRSSTLLSADKVASPPHRKPTQSPPPIPGGRPPVPSVTLNRQSTVQKPSADYIPSSTRMGPFETPRAAPPVASPPSEYVMVEQLVNTLSDEVPVPPPRSRRPPSRPAPAPTTESSGSGWEMPSIPTSLTFDGPQLDLSLSSWSEDSARYAPPAMTGSRSPLTIAQHEPRQPSVQAPPKPPAAVQLSPDELIAVWGRVGVQICETATSLFEKSKRSLVGDGSYYGFVNVVFGQVPNAMPPSSSGYGYLIYAQNGPTVSRRVSEIMPGDVVELYDAMLKGHKGLQSYHQNVGSGEPLVGIVNEFEAKKSKVKVFHANQHVGQQTVESVSYRLEDLKSGVVKIFRVLEV